MTTATKKKTETITTFKIKSTNNLISFLKRFTPISNNLLLEITKDHILAKSYTPDRSVVKYSKIPLSDVLEGTVATDLIKIGIHDISKVCNVFKHFDEGAEIFFDLKTDLIQDEPNGVEMTFRSNNLKINMGCQDLSLFPVYITSDSLKKIIKSVADEKVMEFKFPKEAFIKIKSLCSMDAATDLLKIKIKDGKVFFTGKSFEYELKDVMDANNTPITQELDLSFRNDQFGYIDQETSKFHIGEQKILVKSEDSESLIVLGRTEA